MPRACPERSRRGGKRPGAGAHRGNLNAVKSGRYSRRLHALADSLAGVPQVRSLLLEFHRRQRSEDKKAARLARQALIDLLSSTPDANNPLFVYLRDSIINGEIGPNAIHTISPTVRQSNEH